MTQVSAPAASPSAKTASSNTGRSDSVSPAKISAKQRILTAARQAFSELGYEAASLKVIGERCGVKRTLIMYHFTSKEGLWQAVVLAVKNEHQAAFNRYYAEVDLHSDAMRARQCGVAFLKASREVPEYGRMLIREGLSDSERLTWITEALTPEQIAIPVFDDPDYTRAAFLGLVRQIQAGAMLYVSNMAPLMATEGSALMGLFRCRMRRLKKPPSICWYWLSRACRKSKPPNAARASR